MHVGVVRTQTDEPIGRRLVQIADRVDELMDRYAPQSFAIEQVFAQHNLRTVIGVAQISGILIAAATRRRLDVGVHTPTEVKSAVTGYGRAGKRQVQAMVARILRLDQVPSPPDAADALAIALCHAWRTGAGTPSAQTGQRTAAQERWLEAERVASRHRKVGG